MIAVHMLSHVELRVSFGLALIGLVIVAIAENGRIPVDNPATHLELTMVHEAMVLEYSGRHLAVIELASALKLLLYVSLIACIFAPWGLAPHGRRSSRHDVWRDRLCRSNWPSADSFSRSSKFRLRKCAYFACPIFLAQR